MHTSGGPALPHSDKGQPAEELRDLLGQRGAAPVTTGPRAQGGGAQCPPGEIMLRSHRVIFSTGGSVRWALALVQTPDITAL